jgi:signal transduction histidine kinase
MRMSLRGRLFLWYAIAIPVLVIGLAFAAQQVMVASLRAAIDERLQERSEVITSTIISNPGSSREHYELLIEQLTEQQLPFVPAVVRISDPGRSVLTTFGDIPDPMVPIMNRQLLLPELIEGRFETISIRGHDALRLYTIGVLDPSTQETIALVQTGDSLAPLVTAQRELWQYSLAVAIGGGLIALLIGLFILRWGLHPLDMIINQVQGIGSRDLETGIPREPRPPELQQLADSVNSMLERLDKAFKTREVFIAGVSHDLKTPLTILQTQIEVMQMQPTTDAETKKSIERMSREVRRLVRMTNNMLLNAQLEANPVLVPTEVSLKEVLEDVERDAQTLAEDLELKASASNAPTVAGDYDLLKQMLLNVVDNAIKFTPRGGTLELGLGQENEYAILKVSDSGLGIPQEHLIHITEPFYKAEPNRSKSTGAGLGLAIVKQVVELHGGQLEIESQEGTGTTVTMRLPLAHRR